MLPIEQNNRSEPVMPRRTQLKLEQQYLALDALAVTDRELASVEHLVQPVWGRTMGGKVRTLRRQVRGLQEETRRRYLEQEGQ